MSLTIRRALPADAEVVVEFNCQLAEETEHKTLARSLVRKGVEAALADPNKAVYFLACDEERVLAQMMITFEWSDWRNGWFWWIQSVYVRHESRRRGVFRALFENVRAAAAAYPSVIGLRLYVEDENRAAQATYTQMGMAVTTYRVFERYPL